MKTTYYILFLIVSIALFSACKSSTLDSFHAESQIYFYDLSDRSNTVKDSIMISFARLEPGTTETILEIPLRYIGPVVEGERSFKVSVDRENTTAVEGKHYQLLTELYHIKSGASDGVLPVKIFSTPDLDEVTLQLVLKLEENENFKINFNFTNSDLNTMDLSRYRILFSNKLLKPSWWSSTAETSYLGDFSMKKVETIFMVTQKNLDEIEEAVEKYDWDLLRAIAREVQIYINYNRSIKAEILDENGQAINMGTYVN